MSASTDHAGRVATRNRAASTVRRLTVGIAVSAAAITAGLTGTWTATSAAATPAMTDNSRSTTTTTTTQDYQSSADWGTASVPEQSAGSAHTTSGGC